jgi:tetratricopeptide (TPR) repeat protein
VHVCDAVQFAHQRGIIHRDLKPGNILVDAEGNPRLLDFGLARWTAQPVDTVVSMTNAMLGTLPYMSPEQTRGNPDEIDTRADIYALGVILYELLTGHYPYPVAGQMVEVLKHIAETPPTPPSRVWTADSGVVSRAGSSEGSASRSRLRSRRCPIDDELQTVVLKTLAKERERRYQSAGELARDLERYLKGDAIEAKRDSGWYVIKTKVRRHKAGVLASAAAIALCMTVGVYASNVRSSRQIEREISESVENGVKLMIQDRGSEAFAEFEHALHLDPAEARALGNQAIILKEDYYDKPYANTDTSLLDEAQALCDRALALRPEKAALWNVRAEILYNQGLLNEAEDSAHEAVDLDPEFHQAISNLAKIQALQGKIDESLATYDRGANKARASEAKGRYDDNVIRYHGTVQLFLGQERCKNTFEDAREMDPDDPRTVLMQARMHLALPEHRDEARALVEAQAAFMFIEQQDPRFNRILAQAHLANEQFGDAAAQAEAAIKIGDEPAYGHFIAAIGRFQNGQVDLARDHFEQGLAAWPAAFEERDFLVNAKRGLLWFDTKAELLSLRQEAEELLR